MEIKVNFFSKWFVNSFNALQHIHKNMHDNWKVYEDHYNIKFKFTDSDVFAVFPSEEEATMFMLRWS